MFTNMDVLKWSIYGALLCVIKVGATNIQPNTTINTYNMHEKCGERINMRWKSIYTAEITFDLNLGNQFVPSHHTPAKGDQYSLPVTCELSIESWDFLDRLMVVFQRLHIDTDCGDTYLEVLDGPATNGHSPPVKGLPPTLCKHHVDRVLSVPYTTSDKHLTFRVHGQPGDKATIQFTAIVVAYHDGTCMSYQHTCASGRCIMDDLVCNGYNPCGDHSDCPADTGEPREVSADESHVLVAALVALSATIVALIVGVVIVCHCYRKHRKHMRQQQYLSSYGRADSMPPPAQYERTISQIEAEHRLAPPSYSTLEPAAEEEDQPEMTVENEQPIADPCLQPDDNNPPSYACVMSHQDEFKLSDKDLRRSGRSTPNADT